MASSAPNPRSTLNGAAKVAENVACPQCGTENPPQAKFCNECANPLLTEALYPDITSIPVEEPEAKVWEEPVSRDPFFAQLEFQFPFRRYQALALDRFEDLRKVQSKFHLVAPPGGGKTIIGLEIVKRLGVPAVVFSPTTTIQAQWRDKCSFFSLPAGQNDVLSRVSMDSHTIGPISAFTYQVLSTPTEEREFVNKLAVDCWKDDLFARQKMDDDSANERIRAIEANNRESFDREMSRYREKVRRSLLADPDSNVRDFLHTNAKALIDSLVKSGVRAIILDECHHLLDYWAIIIRELQKSIGNCFTVGLTATPPLSAQGSDLENYLRLVGKVDFEVPTPAMVKNGDLAPYQDLVHIVRCTDQESKFLKGQQRTFLDIVQRYSAQDSFRTYFQQKIFNHGTTEGNEVSWDDFLAENLRICVSGIRFLLSVEVQMPQDIPVLKEMKEPLNTGDWLALIESYCLDYLKMRDSQEDKKQLAEIKAALRSLGMSMGESGLRRYVSPQQRVIALSENKTRGAVEILRHEYRSMKETLLAVVITDFEKCSPTALTSLKGVLDTEAGGAARALRYIIADSETDHLDAVMITGQSVLLDIDIRDKFKTAAEEWLSQNRLTAEFTVRDTQYPKVCEVVGEGKDWRPRTYVRLMTALFETGVTRCIVGTRGLLGEGWDSLSLNTLIDLTSATTYSMVNQVRGRSIRLNPLEPKKLANNWDVVCIEPDVIDGESDYFRLIRKHEQYYGMTDGGYVTKGIAHLNSRLARIDTARDMRTDLRPVILDMGLINEEAFARAENRTAAYDLWRVGQPFDDESVPQVQVDANKINFRTAFTFWNSLKALLLAISGIFATVLLYSSRGMFQQSDTDPLRAILIVIMVSGLVATALSSKLIFRYFKKAFIDLPVDGSLKDIGIAILRALQERGLISAKFTALNIKVEEIAVQQLAESGVYRVFLDRAGEREAELFSKCYAEAMQPIRDQRYLVSRDETSMKGNYFSPLWYAVRSLTRALRKEEIAYHPVPEVFGRTKETAAAFADTWASYVGGGQLIYTRSKSGRAILLKYGLDRRLDLGVSRANVWN